MGRVESKRPKSFIAAGLVQGVQEAAISGAAGGHLKLGDLCGERVGQLKEQKVGQQGPFLSVITAFEPSINCWALAGQLVMPRIKLTKNIVFIVSPQPWDAR